MKELSIEEKAKAYDEVLERAKDYQKVNGAAGSAVISEIFPELVENESKDEQLRKNCIHFLELQKSHHAATFEIEECIAWLEKQGEKTNPYSGTFFNYNGHTWGMCARDNGVDILLDKQLFTHLEKSSEQKDPCEDCSNPKLNCSNFPCIEKKAFDSGKSVFEYIKTEHEQKPTDKVKPKFKVGDWIVDNRTGVVHYIAKIKGTVDGCYYVLGYDKRLLHVDNESDYHLWTIKDSKDGDVLAVDGRPFIYDGSKNSVTVGAYCGFNEENIFRRTYNSVINQNIVPATKEQRDFLFQKMGELGYVWDSHDKMIICSTDTESK